MSPDHICNSESCPEGANYFVTALDAGFLWYMAGPYATHREALAAVGAAMAIGIKNNPWSYFFSWGTVKGSSRSEPGSITKARLLL